MELLLQEGKMDMKIGKIEISKKLFITFIVVVLLAIIAFIVKKVYITKYENYKIDKDKEFIYTYKTYNSSDTSIPYINIDTDYIKNLNNEIQKFGINYETSNTSNNSMSYRYNVSDNIVSLVIILKKLDSNNKLVIDYMTYVFDLNQDGKVLKDEEILKKYNISVDEVDYEISSQMVQKYNDEIDKKIIPGECEYNPCYLNLRNVSKYTDNAHYFIEDGWLVVYTTYNTYSQYKEEDYYGRDDFKFYIIDKKKN